MKITAVHVETLELEMEEPFVIASSALANATHGDADLPWRPGGSTLLALQAPGPGIALDEYAVAARRAARRW